MYLLAILFWWAKKMCGNILTMLKLIKQALKENFLKNPLANFFFLTLEAVENNILKLKMMKLISESNFWVSLNIDAVDLPSLAD